jgi:hypothetical protein
MAQFTYLTEAQAIIKCEIWDASGNRILLPGVSSWTSFEGGDMQASTTTMLPGGTMPAVAMPAPAKRTNVTLKRPYTMQLHPFIPALEGAVGRGRVSASYTPFDSDGNQGQTITRHGFLKELQIPTWDAASGETVYLGVVMECDS